MNRTTINTLIRNMKKAGIVTKVTEWQMVGMSEGEQAIKYVGIKIDTEWEKLFSKQNNLLITFILEKNSAKAVLSLANVPPFVPVFTSKLTDMVKWETLLGEWKRALNRDKEAYTKGNANVSNSYNKIRKFLRK